MELNKEQNEKLRTKAIKFIDEIRDITKDKQLHFDINLYSYYNTYGGLTLKIRNNYFGYETDKTRFTTIYTSGTHTYDDCVYASLKRNSFGYYNKILLDLLANRDKIIKELNEEIKYKCDLLNKILGDDK